MRSIASAGELATKLSPLMSPAVPPSVWRSPVPYLFGGLAAVMGLIALSLLMLSCSYWRRPAGRRLDERERRSSEMDLESGGEGKDAETKVPKVYEEKVLVIMAGNEKPTFLATPVRAKAASCGEGNHVERDDQKKKKKGDKAENFETTKKEADDDEDEDTRTEENTVVSTSQQETPELAQGHNQL